MRFKRQFNVPCQTVSAAETDCRLSQYKSHYVCKRCPSPAEWLMHTAVVMISYCCCCCCWARERTIVAASQQLQAWARQGKAKARQRQGKAVIHSLTEAESRQQPTAVVVKQWSSESGPARPTVVKRSRPPCEGHCLALIVSKTHSRWIFCRVQFECALPVSLWVGPFCEYLCVSYCRILSIPKLFFISICRKKEFGDSLPNKTFMILKSSLHWKSVNPQKVPFAVKFPVTLVRNSQNSSKFKACLQINCFSHWVSTVNEVDKQRGRTRVYNPCKGSNNRNSRKVGHNRTRLKDRSQPCMWLVWHEQDANKFRVHPEITYHDHYLQRKWYVCTRVHPFLYCLV